MSRFENETFCQIFRNTFETAFSDKTSRARTAQENMSENEGFGQFRGHVSERGRLRKPAQQILSDTTVRDTWSFGCRWTLASHRKEHQ